MNFHDYLGDQIRFETPESFQRTRGRLTLKAHGWRINVDQQPAYSKRRKVLEAEGGYLLGHVGRIQKVDEKPIDFQQAEKVLQCLQFYFAFLRGFWCGPVIPEGIGVSSTLWTTWANWKLTPWLNVRSWFPTIRTREVGLLYREFQKKWSSPLWEQVIRHCIYWYIQSNAESGSSEARTLTSFIALEMLGWAYMVEDEGLMSIGKFDSLPAADKIEALLNSLGISTAIPQRFQRLRRAASSRHISSGPKFLARFRNALVHPDPPNRRFLSRIDGMTKWELAELGLTYFELALLSILSYQGQYRRRVFKGYAGEAEALVPWVL
ncbi:hypothetical protein ACFL39_01535 [Gemmatimonadota bacterium]